MAMPDAQSAMKLVNDGLELLESPAHCSSFLSEGNGRFGSYSNLKKRFNRSGVRKDFAFSAKHFWAIYACSCIANTSSSVDAKREKSYKMFYERRISAIPKHWDDFHVSNHCSTIRNIPDAKLAKRRRTGTIQGHG